MRLAPLAIGVLFVVSACEAPPPGSTTTSASPATSQAGETYVGQYRDGKYEGRGSLTYANGEKYVGQFHDGLRDGQGTYAWADGRRYVGGFHMGVPNGRGTYTFPNGEKYDGDYRDNRRDGQGSYAWPDGRRYVGQFHDDRPNGLGTYTWPDGKKYVGEFRDGQANGRGTYTWPDGRKYVGELRDDLPDGRGTLTYADGRQKTGEFRNGDFVGVQAGSTLAAYDPGKRAAVGPVEIEMHRRGGAFTVPVLINNAVTLDFYLDSGSADVSVPAQVFDSLKQAGTVQPDDLIGSETYQMADGSPKRSQNFRIHSLKAGDVVLENIRGSVSNYAGPPLLGMSFLGRFKSWSVDNDRHVLILN